MSDRQELNRNLGPAMVGINADEIETIDIQPRSLV